VGQSPTVRRSSFGTATGPDPRSGVGGARASSSTRSPAAASMLRAAVRPTEHGCKSGTATALQPRLGTCHKRVVPWLARLKATFGTSDPAFAALQSHWFFAWCPPLMSEVSVYWRAFRSTQSFTRSASSVAEEHCQRATFGVAGLLDAEIRHLHAKMKHVWGEHGRQS
jgi:hypothetical protein